MQYGVTPLANAVHGGKHAHAEVTDQVPRGWHRRGSPAPAKRASRDRNLERQNTCSCPEQVSTTGAAPVLVSSPVAHMESNPSFQSPRVKRSCTHWAAPPQKATGWPLSSPSNMCCGARRRFTRTAAAPHRSAVAQARVVSSTPRRGCSQELATARTESIW